MEGSQGKVSMEILTVSSWCWGWSSGTLPGDPHQSPCVHREPCLTHIPALQQGRDSFLPLLIPLHHTTPANLQQHDRGASKVREPHADSLADMWQMGCTIFLWWCNVYMKLFVVVVIIIFCYILMILAGICVALFFMVHVCMGKKTIVVST